MDKINERCAICGEPIEDDDKKIFCPDCGAPMHEDCYLINGKCPNSDKHIPRNINAGNNQTSMNNDSARLFPDGDGCEICGKAFSDNDEKVYCPDCGASMHRVCYSMTHRCPYANEHDSVNVNAAVQNASVKTGAPVCEICGKPLDNGEEKVYCPICGTPVHSSCWQISPECPNKHRHSSGYDWEADHKRQKEAAKKQNIERNLNNISFENFPQMIMDNPIKSPEDGQELTCYGVKQSELVHFLGTENFSTPRFLTLFLNMANSGKVFSLNLSAWFFAPLYHFYRRMTGPAIILSLVTFILMIPTLIMELMYWSRTEAPVINDPLSFAATVTSYIMIIVRVVILIFSDYFYMRWSVGKIMSIREQYKDSPEDEYYAALEHRGNPRMLYVLGGVSLILFLMYMFNIFISASGIFS